MGLPTGLVTFLFSDIEGSTRLARDLEPRAWASVLERHDALADGAVATHHGTVLKHEGDGMFAVFEPGPGALDAAVALQRAVAAEPWPESARLMVRIGVHQGMGALTAGGADYVGVDVHYAARIAAAANGGQIVVSDTARATLPDAPAGATFVDDGLLRVRDFDEPRHLFRLVVPKAADDARPLRAKGPPSNLPDALTSFVGRDEEVAEIRGAILGARLVTLTGPGGTGKTRLSLAVAGRLAGELDGGAWLVELAPVTDPGLVPSAIAAALGVEEEPGRPMTDTLKDALRERHALLVLDNFEQVVEAASFVADLVRTAPGLRVLVSSRELLRVAGEREYRVPALRSMEAVMLFVDRARTVRPDFSLTDATAATVAAICRRLDDLPLAIELAAARTRLFPPDALLARLEQSLEVLGGGTRDLPERQRTLRSTIAWSHDLLDDAERTLFRRLAVFGGGWTLEAAEAVADPDGVPGLLVGDVLISLVDKSLVVESAQAGAAVRFDQLVTIRAFAAEQLDASGERLAVERRHADYFAAYAEAAEPALEYGDPAAALDSLSREDHNLRTALAWSIRGGSVEPGLRIASAIWRYWQHRSHLREGLEWSRALVERSAEQAPSRPRFGALNAAGGLAYWLAAYDEAAAHYAAALEVATQLGDDRLRGEIAYSLGFLAMVAGDTALLRERFEESGRLFAAAGDRMGVSKVRQGLVVSFFLDGDYATAKRIGEEDNAFQREIGARYRLADGETLVAVAAFRLGDLDGAVAHLCEALAVDVELDLSVGYVGNLIVGSLIATAAGDAARGARIAGAVAVLRESTGSSAAPMDVLHLPDPADEARRALGDEDFERELAAGRALTLPEAVELAGRTPVTAQPSGR